MGVYQDTNTGVPPPAGVVRSLNYAIHGTYPCRKFIVNFDNFALFSCGYNMGVQTYQMVLYEISNIIEVYVKRRHVGSCTWNQGQGVIQHLVTALHAVIHHVDRLYFDPVSSRLGL